MDGDTATRISDKKYNVNSSIHTKLQVMHTFVIAQNTFSFFKLQKPNRIVGLAHSLEWFQS